MSDWASRFLSLARTVAGWSKDSTQVGAVAVEPASKRVLQTGYNGIPRGVRDLPSRLERPHKYRFVCHAEANLVAHAARSVLQGATVYVTHQPCADCAKLLINAGVARVVCGDGSTAMSAELFDAARVMFAEAGVEVEMQRSNQQ